MSTALSLSDISRLGELEKLIETGQQTFMKVGLAILEIRDHRLYRKDYDTFEVYCRERWGWEKSHSHRLMDAAKVVNALPPPLAAQIPNENTARALAKVPVGERTTVVENVVKSNLPISSTSIKQEVEHQQVTTKTSPMGEVLKCKVSPYTRLDATGYIIPPKILPLWDKSEEIGKALIKKLRDVKDAIKGAVDENNPVVANLNSQAVSIDIEDAINGLKNLIPHAVCYTCQGQNTKDCCACKGRGFIDAFFYRQCVPEELKTIRAKSNKKP